jgi:NADH-quinone oxidoreductase subunit L
MRMAIAPNTASIQHAVHGHHEDTNEETAHDGHSHAGHSHGDGTAGYHPHESPLSMLIPLGVLSLGAVFAGYLFSHTFISEGEGEFWRGSVAFSEHLIHAMHQVPGWVKWAPFTVMALGLFTAWQAYIRDTDLPRRVVEQIGVLYRFVYNKWYFDELYDFLFVRPAFWIGRLLWKQGDVGVIDRFGPDGAAWAVAQGARLAKKVQTGYLYSYALVMLLGLVGAVSWAIGAK